MAQKSAAVFGGSGFVGRYVVRALAREGYRVNVISRDPERNLQLKVNGPTGQIAFTRCDIRDEKSVAAAVQGADVVVNLVAVLYQRGKQRFDTIQAQGAAHIAKAARKAGVKQLVHISALGIESAPSSLYAKTKLEGEKAVLAAFPTAVILRPSIIFGQEDGFFNMFACLFRFLPFVPLIGGGGNRMQPVYAADVAEAVICALHLPHMDGKTFELGGPKTYTMRELFEYILQVTNRSKCFVSIPYALASLKGAICEMLPFKPLITRDQVKLLKVDNVVGKDALTFRQLGLTPRPLEDIVPGYLTRFRKR